MAIKFVLMVNKQGQTRLASYFDWYTAAEKTTLESEITRRCLARTELQCSFIEYRGLKVVYRRYASLFFVVAVDGDDENELGILEFIHSLVEVMDKYFDSVCELDIMYHIDKVAKSIVIINYFYSPLPVSFLYLLNFILHRICASSSIDSFPSNPQPTLP